MAKRPLMSLIIFRYWGLFTSLAEVNARLHFRLELR